MNLMEQIREEVNKGRLILYRKKNVLKIISAVPGCCGYYEFLFTKNPSAAVSKAFAYKGPEVETKE